MRGRFGPVALIGLASLLTVASGVILKEGGEADAIWFAGAAILAAGAVNLLRLVVWRRAHRLYPLSLTYPLTGLTFPLVLIVSALYDEPVGPVQVGAVVLIVVGVTLIHRSQDESPPSGGEVRASNATGAD